MTVFRPSRLPSGCARALAVTLAAAALLAPPPPARAGQRPKWELGAGGVFFTQPDYVGSDEYRLRALPFPWIVYRGEVLRFDRDSMQTKIFGTELVRLDISASGQVAVDSNDCDRRHGMPNRHWMAEIGPSLRFKVAHSADGRHVLDVDVPLRTAIAADFDHISYEGIVASPKLEYRFEPDNWRFDADAGLEFQDNDYNEYYYGVAPKWSTPDRAAYGTEGGYSGLRVSVGVNRYIGPFYVGAFARYVNIAGTPFEDSPLVGSEHNFVGGIAIGWVLMKSDTMVPVGAEANRLSYDPPLLPSSGPESSPAGPPAASPGGGSPR